LLKVLEKDHLPLKLALKCNINEESKEWEEDSDARCLYLDSLPCSHRS